MERYTPLSDAQLAYNLKKKVPMKDRDSRPVDCPNFGLICELLWAKYIGPKARKLKDTKIALCCLTVLTNFDSARTYQHPEDQCMTVKRFCQEYAVQCPKGLKAAITLICQANPGVLLPGQCLVMPCLNAHHWQGYKDEQTTQAKKAITLKKASNAKTSSLVVRGKAMTEEVLTLVSFS